MLNLIYRSIVGYLLLLFLFSCSAVTDPNSDFNDKYYSQVQSILNAMPSQGANEVVDYKNKTSFGPVTHDEVVSESLRSNQQYYPYFDIRKFGSKSPTRHLPNMEVYDQSRSQSQMPPDIFEVTYERREYYPFKYQGARFDSITVPSRDIYGVETVMTNKDYLLAGNNAVQNSIENIRSNKNAYDAQNSKELIAEKKRLRHERKIAKIFGVGAISEDEIAEQELEEKESNLQELAEQELENGSEDISMKEQVDDTNS